MLSTLNSNPFRQYTLKTSDYKLARVGLIYEYAPFVGLSPWYYGPRAWVKTKELLTDIKQKKEQ